MFRHGDSGKMERPVGVFEARKPFLPSPFGARREARGARAGSASRPTLGHGVIEARKPVPSCAAHLNAAGEQRVERFGQRVAVPPPPRVLGCHWWWQCLPAPLPVPFTCLRDWRQSHSFLFLCRYMHKYVHVFCQLSRTRLCPPPVGPVLASTSPELKTVAVPIYSDLADSRVRPCAA